MKSHLFLAASALALAACGNSDDASAPDAAPVDPNPLAESAVEPSPALPTTAQGFVDTASASDMFEVEAGKLAQANGKAQEVKDFGAMMVKDHTKSTADLKAAAAKVDGVTVAPVLTAKQQSDLDALKAAGDGFDSLYKTQQLAAHEQALALLKNFAAAGDAQSLKDFAGKTGPVVEAHLEHVQTLP
jgi:putative membrane protein